MHLPLRVPHARRRAGLLLATALLAVPGCGRSPTSSQATPVSIVGLTIANTIVEPGAPIHVDATVASPLNATARDALVAIAGADTVQVSLSPSVCVIEGHPVMCGEVVFVVPTDRRADVHEAAVRSLGGVLVTRPGPVQTEWLGLVRVPIGDEIRVRDALRGIDGIIGVQFNDAERQRRHDGEGATPAPRAIIHTAAGPGRAGDGVLQISAGSTVRIASRTDASVFVNATVAGPP